VLFEGVLRAAGNAGLWTITNGILQEADVPRAVLLSAGTGGAVALQDGRWISVFSAEEMERQYIEAGVQ